MAHTILLDLSIGPDELARFYRGEARAVVARARDGRWIRFPVHVLRRVVTRAGVHGTFALQVDGARLIGLQPVPKYARGR